MNAQQQQENTPSYHQHNTTPLYDENSLHHQPQLHTIFSASSVHIEEERKKEYILYGQFLEKYNK